MTAKITEADEAERRLLKVRMAERGLKAGCLAKLTGRNPRQITNLLTGNNQTWPIRAEVNAALGEEIFSRNRTLHMLLKPLRIATEQYQSNTEKLSALNVEEEESRRRLTLCADLSTSDLTATTIVTSVTATLGAIAIKRKAVEQSIRCKLLLLKLQFEHAQTVWAGILQAKTAAIKGGIAMALHPFWTGYERELEQELLRLSGQVPALIQIQHAFWYQETFKDEILLAAVNNFISHVEKHSQALSIQIE